MAVVTKLGIGEAVIVNGATIEVRAIGERKCEVVVTGGPVSFQPKMNRSALRQILGDDDE